MKEYCISDVDILRKCCLKLRKLYIETCEIDPFQYLTIASVCMAIYKYNFVDKSFPTRTKTFESKWTGDPSKYPDDKRKEYNISKKDYEDTTKDIVFEEKKIGRTALVKLKEE